MRVLVVNKYHKLTGGADRYALDLAKLLHEHGHPVAFLTMDQSDNWTAKYTIYAAPVGLTTKNWNKAGACARARAFVDGVYNRAAEREAERAMEEFRPDVVHLQNIFFQLSPSVIRPAKRRGVPVVQTLHDYQPICANNALHVKGRVCESCRPRRFHNILKNRCYNDSLSASLLAFCAKVIHSATGAYPASVDRFIAPSLFLKEKTETFGVPMAEIGALDYFLDFEQYEPSFEPGGYILFLGQLLRRKGIFTLLDAAEKTCSSVPFVFVGAGPEGEELRAETERRKLRNVSFAGYKSGSELFETIRAARVVVVPSEWYENQPYAILESFALGKPVVASSIGGIPELVNDAVGRLFPPGDSDALAERLDEIIGRDDLLRNMGRAARELVVSRFTPELHLERILKIYQSLIDGAR
jgi:glycosyltransferase involved in cell wall biosynthesis